MSKPIVSLVNVEKWYGTNHVVKNMNINIAEGGVSDTVRTIRMWKDNDTAYDFRF